VFHCFSRRGGLIIATIALVGAGPLANVLTSELAVATAPAPSFSASSIEFDNAGGTIRFHGVVPAGATCTFSSTPSLTGLPASTACSGGTFSISATVPVNLATSSISYAVKLSFTVSSTVTVLKVAVGQAPPPHILSWGATKTIDPPQGNPSAVSCAPGSTFCMTVDNAGDAIALNGSAWSWPVSVSSGASRSLNAISCPSTTLCFAVGQQGIFEYQSGAWTSHTAVTPSGFEEDMTAIACPSVNFCIAGSSGGATVTWSSGTHTWTSAGSPTSSIAAVSCFSDTSCYAASSSSAEVIHYSAGSWGSPVTLPNTNPIVTLSCSVGTTFCLATDGTRYTTLDSGTWSTSALISIITVINGVSCDPGLIYCLGAGSGGAPPGDILGFNTDHWGGSTSIANGTPALGAISCASKTFCVALPTLSPSSSPVGDAGYVWNGTNWTSSTIDNRTYGRLDSISCPSAKFCAAVDSSGYSTTYNGTSWRAPVSTVPTIQGGPSVITLDAVSCSSASFCVAVGRNGTEATYVSGSWMTPSVIDNAASNNLVSVSCLSNNFCMALDQDARALMWNGVTWTSPTGVGASQASTGSLSCRMSFLTPTCYAVVSFTEVATYKNGSWGAPVTVDPSISNILMSISCSNATTCMTGDNGDSYFTLGGTTWTQGTLTSGAGFTHISCISENFCLGIDETSTNNFAIFTGVKWSAWRTFIGVSSAPPVISCVPAASICAVVDVSGRVSFGT